MRAAAEPKARTDAATRAVVMIPCWRRPEFLWHCLHNLLQAQGAEQLHYIFRPDSGASPENFEVIQAFAARMPSFEVQTPSPCPYRRTKQSANLLLGYLAAAQMSQRLVYMVEEDVIVARDFFRWHTQVHQQHDDLFCSIAVKNIHREKTPEPEANAYYLTRDDYCSLGVCFDADIIRRYIAPHVNLQYLRRPKAYVRRKFPHSTVAEGFVEQDGLIRRVQEQCARAIAYPCAPRAYHAGYYGYHRPGALYGSLSERVEQLGAIIYSATAMQAAATSEQYVTDSVPVSLEPLQWQTLRQVNWVV